MEIKQYKVENNVAVGINPYVHEHRGSFTVINADKISEYASFDEAAHTYATNAKDGAYDADCFGQMEYQFTDTSFDDEWHSENEDTYERYPKYELYECHAKTLDPKYKTRRFLPLNPIPKMETTELPSPEISQEFIHLDINDFSISESDLERAFCFGWLSNPENNVLDNTEMMRRYELFKMQYLSPMLSRKGIIH